MLTGFPPPLGQKLSQLFCLPACSTIIDLAVRLHTERRFALLVVSIFPLSSRHTPPRRVQPYNFKKHFSPRASSLSGEQTTCEIRNRSDFPPASSPSNSHSAYHEYPWSRAGWTGGEPPAPEKPKKRQVQESFRKQNTGASATEPGFTADHKQSRQRHKENIQYL